MTLCPRERSYLKGLGHHLEPLVQIGKEGLGAPQVAALEQALFDHELIKVRLGKNAPLEFGELIEALPKLTKAEVVQHIGKVVLIYKARPEKPTIDLAASAPNEFEDERLPRARPARPAAKLPR